MPSNFSSVGFVLLWISFAMTGGCGGSSSSDTPSPTRLAPAALYGNWHLIHVTGGFTGGGQPITHRETLSFHPNGTVVHMVDANTDFDGRYQVVRSTAQFDSHEEPVVEYLPLGRTSYVIREASSTRLVLSMEGADGFTFEYEPID